MFGDLWKTCPDFPKFVCTMTGEVKRKDGKEFPLYHISSGKGRERLYKSLRSGFGGHVHRQIFKAWGPPNPDTDRYTCVDHMDNDPQNNHIDNLRWSCASLNALNTDDRFKGWTLDRARTMPYKSHIKWLGQTTSLGRFKTQEEASARYMECKAWLQVAYREHRWKDKALIWIFRLIKHLGHMRPDHQCPECERTLTQMNRSMANLDQFIANLA